MKLSIHDLLTMNQQDSVESVFNHTKDFVLEMEKIGYHRYWFAEHHSLPSHLSSAPELLISCFASITNKIRLGSGGTMIMHYSPLKIAEWFKTLSVLSHGRADLGLGRAPGGSRNEIIALSENRAQVFTDLYTKIEDILALISDQEPNTHYLKSSVAVPNNIPILPQPWMLGSSGQSALKTAELGLGYSFAKFFSVETNPDVFKLYRERFNPSIFFEKPEVIVSYQIIVADTPQEADYLAKPLELSKLSAYTSHPKLIQSPEAIKDYKFTPYEEAFLRNQYEKRFIIKGSQEQVKQILENEINTLGIDEIMVYSPIFDQKDRIKSHKLLYEIFHG